MAVSYLYRACTPTAPGVLKSRLEAATNLVIANVIMLGPYAYLEFMSALSADEKTSLDTAVGDYNGIFAGTDNAPTQNIAAFVRVPDGSFWKLEVSDLGIVTTDKVD